MGKTTTVLMILDGYGLSKEKKGNAIKLAKTPIMDSLMKNYPFAEGNASGLFVGLPDGQMGNSEVGHLNMGAGRIVYQELTRITKDIQDGNFFEEKVLKKAMEDCKEKDTALHLMGLLSSGGVHSHKNHLYGLLKMAKMNGLEKVYVHAFLDGRDTSPTSAKGFVKELIDKTKEIGVGEIATISGRYYAMDRDNHWERVEQSYNAMALGKGNTTEDVISYIENSYTKGVNDEFILPTVITKNDAPVATIRENDSVIFFNFRPDRAREITRAFCSEDFNKFERANGYFKLNFVTFIDYDSTIPNKKVVFSKESLSNTFGQYISDLGLTQLRLAETEKYAHVTFFFNGGVEEPYKNEERILIKSPNVATYDLKPEMSGAEVTKNLIESINSAKYDVIIVNYANPDMVGHTGIIDASIKAVEIVDEFVKEVVEAIISNDAQMFICADHGNIDKLIDEKTGEPFTAHTTNPVPFILINCDKAKALKEGGKLADIAPTLLDAMDIAIPKEMTGTSLIIETK